MLANIFQFAWIGAQEQDLSNEGSIVLLDFVEAKLRCSKPESKPSIRSIGTSIRFIGTDGSSHTLGPITYIGIIAWTDHDAARALVEWT